MARAVSPLGALRRFIETSLDEAAIGPAQLLLRSYVIDKLNSVPGVAREMGMRQFAGTIASHDPRTKEGRTRRLEGFIASAEALGRHPGPVGFDLALMLFDARRELHRLTKRDSLSGRDIDDLLDVSEYVVRRYAPTPQRIADLASHVAAAQSEIRHLQNLFRPSSEMGREALIEQLAGYERYYTGDVSAFIADAGGDGGIVNQALGIIGSLRAAIQMAPLSGGPMGEDALLEMIRETEGIDTTIDELRSLATETARRDHANIRQALVELELPPTRRGLRQLTSQRVTDVLDAAASQLIELHGFLEHAGVIDVPRLGEVIVGPAETFKAWTSAYVDHPGPYDDDTTTYYRISLPDDGWTPQQRHDYLPFEEQLLLTSVHEVYPGHVVQHAASDDLGPMRYIAKSTAFTEGWAHYTELMVVEAGLRDRDPRIRIGQALKSLLRVCRTLAALDIHVRGKDPEDVMATFERIAFADPMTARKQTMRGIVEPGYISYLIGKRHIIALREQFMGAGMGDLREFHRWLLSHGAPPLPLLEEELRSAVQGTM